MLKSIKLAILPLSLLIIHCSLLIVLLVILSSCSNSTSGKSGSLSGTVILTNDTSNSALDPDDYAGVTVALYKTAVLDSSLVRINSEYPQIGVLLTQETEFDHRLQTPVKTTQTSPDGSFNLSKITAGKYNLVIYKTGWGIRYLYDIDIAEGDNTLNQNNSSSFIINYSLNTRSQLSKSAIVLYPETAFSGIVMESITFAADHVYRFSQNTTLTGNIELNEKAVLLIDPDVQLDVYGEVTCNAVDAFCRITSGSGMYTTNIQTLIEPFYHIKFTNQINPVALKNIILDYSVSGMQFSNSSASLNNSMIRECSSFGLSLLSDSSHIYECLFRDNSDINIFAANTIQVEQNIFYRNGDNCRMQDTEATVQNNYFLQNFIGLRPIYGTNEIKYNCFDKNTIAIAPCAANPIITRNNFYKNETDIEMNRNYVQSSYDYCSPDIQFNNFRGDGLYFDLLGEHGVNAIDQVPRPGVISNQSYPNNYYKATNLTTHIWDANHPDGEEFLYSVSVNPRSYNIIFPAGIE